MNNLPKRIALGLVVALFLIIPIKVFAQSNNDQSEQVQIKIGVLANRGHDKTLERWKPLADYLTNASNQRDDTAYVYEIVPLKYSEIYDVVENEEIDFILVNPAIYIELEELYGVSRISTMESLRLGEGYDQFGGVIFTSKKLYPNSSIDDFKNRNFGAVEKNSLGGYYAGMGELAERKINPESFFSNTYFLGTDDDVVYAVLEGRVDIGTVSTGTLEVMQSENKIKIDDFHIVIDHRETENEEFHTHSKKTEKFPFAHSTDLYPEWPMAKLKNTPNDVAKNISHSLLEFDAKSDYAEKTGVAGWVVPKQYSSVRDLLKTLKLPPYEEYGEFDLLDFVVKFSDLITAFGILLAAIVLFVLIVLIFNVRVKISNQKLEKLIDLSKAVILELDLDGKIILINKYGANLLGFTDKDKLLGLNWIEEFIPKDRQDETVKLLQKIESGNSSKSKSQTTIVKSKSGREYKIEWDNSLIRKRRKVIGIFRYGINVTEKENYIEKLKKQSEEVDRINKKMVGRELKMKQLKQEIDELRKSKDNG